MQKNCTKCKEQFEVTENDLKFYEKISPVFGGKKYLIPEPTLCPPCREQRRLVFRNERSLYKRKCDASGKEIISMYAPNSPFKVYHQDEWWSDRWDPLEYGKEYDPSRSFLDQLYELSIRVPRSSLYNKGSENSEYTNYSNYNKNCYLVFGGWKGENLLYCYTPVGDCKDCVDRFWIQGCENCYENIDCQENYEVFFAQNTTNSKESLFLYDCTNCTNCAFCTNLRNKENYLFNKPSSKEEIDAVRKKIYTFSGLQNQKKIFKEFLTLQGIFRYYIGENNEIATGNYIYGSKDIHASFSIFDSENISYSLRTLKQTSSMDVEGCGYGNNVYECMSTDFSQNTFSCLTSEYLSNCYYSDHCYHSLDLFGCIGIRNKQYCILNKQYSKKSFEELVPKIIEQMNREKEWGEFYPCSHSPFAYNETVAIDYYPLSENEVLSKKWKWYRDERTKDVSSDGTNIIEREQIPNQIQEYDESIIKKILLCEVTKKPYKIVPQEYAFYLRHNLPLPRKHPDQRHKERIALRNPRTLYPRTCMCANPSHTNHEGHDCTQTFETTYAPDRPEKVVCEECYQREIY